MKNKRCCSVEYILTKNAISSGTYVENVDVGKRLTLRGEGASVVTAQAANSNDHVFDVTANWVNISGVNAYGSTTSGKAGIYVGDGIAHSNISNSAASNNYYGIYLDRSNNSILTENTPSKNYMHGIRLAYSSNNTLLNNIVSSDNACTILLYASANNRLINNDVSNSFKGIFMYTSSNDNLVSGNTASGNRQGGIYLEGNNNTITGNNALNNGNFGILLESSSNNTLYHNNLDGNTNNNAYDYGNNQWDSGSEGNYYSDYVGTDSNGDGIADTPYPIPGGSSVDRYPLMVPWDAAPTTGPVHNINKGTNYTINQAAIDDASPGDEIHVDSGMYYENVVLNKPLILLGESNFAATIDGNGGEKVFEVIDNEVVIEGFRIQNGSIGIYVTSSYNTLIGNTVSNNSIGIYMYSSSYNTLYQNNLFSNTDYNAYDYNGNNQWDSGSKGNYYSDYTGTDSNGDGIGDTPYNISGGAGAQDRYPLMQPWNEGGSEVISIGSSSAPTNSTITIPVSVEKSLTFKGYLLTCSTIQVS